MHRLLAALLILGTISVHAQTQDVAAEVTLKALLDEDLDASLRRNPIQATVRGVPGYGHLLPDLSLAELSRQHARERRALERLKALDPKALRGQDRISYELLLDKMELAVEAQQFTDAQALVLSTLGGLHTYLPRAAQVTPFKTADDYRDYVKRISGDGEARRRHDRTAEARPGERLDDPETRRRPRRRSHRRPSRRERRGKSAARAVRAHGGRHPRGGTRSDRRGCPPRCRRRLPAGAAALQGVHRRNVPAEGARRGRVGFVSGRRALLRFPGSLAHRPGQVRRASPRAGTRRSQAPARGNRCHREGDRLPGDDGRIHRAIANRPQVLLRVRGRRACRVSGDAGPRRPCSSPGFSIRCRECATRCAP